MSRPRGFWEQRRVKTASDLQLLKSVFALNAILAITHMLARAETCRSDQVLTLVSINLKSKDGTHTPYKEWGPHAPMERCPVSAKIDSWTPSTVAAT